MISPPQNAQELAARLLRCRWDQTRRKLVDGCDGAWAGEVAEVLAEIFAQRIRSKLSRAEAVVVAARILAEQVKTPLCRAWAQRLAGVFDHLRGRPLSGDRRLRRAAGLFTEAGNVLESGDTHRIRVQVLALAGRFADAEEAARQARRAWRRAGGAGPCRRAGLEMNLGNLHHGRDELVAARRCYRRAARLFRVDEDPRVAQAGYNEANVLASLDRLDGARELYESALEQFIAAGQEALACQAEYALASLDLLEAMPDAALARLRRVRRRQVILSDTRGVAHSNLEMARALLALNRLEPAVQAAKEAEVAFRKAHHRVELAVCWCLRAAVARRTGRQGIAARLYERAANELAGLGNSLASSWARLGWAECRLRAGAPAEALTAARAAERVFASQKLRTRQARAAVLVAECCRAFGRQATARSAAGRALALGRRLGSARTLLAAYRTLAGIERQWSDRAAEYRWLRRAEQCVSDLRTGVTSEESELAFLLDKTDIYEALVANRLQRSDRRSLREALEYTERAKAHALSDQLCQERSAPSVEARSRRQELLARLVKLERELAVAERRLEEPPAGGGGTRTRSLRLQGLTQRMHETLRRLHKNDPAAAVLSGAPVPPVSELLEELESDELVVEFTSIGEHYQLFLADSWGVECYPDIARVEELDGLIERLFFHLGKDVLGPGHADRHGEFLSRSCRSYLRQLERHLLAPVAGALEGRRLRIVPHGRLHGLPFHAFEDDKGQALVERATVAYAPSLAVRSLLLRERRQLGGPSIVIGAADASTPRIEEEIRAVADYLPSAQVLRGPAASAQALRLAEGGPPVLHVASHGFFSEAGGGLGALRFGDDLVAPQDIQRLSGMATLVVLSGCQTGRGAVHSGDELVGLVRGFFLAGARAVVASLWEVHDASACMIMTDFYRRLAQGVSVERSLADAQRLARARDPNPLRWAPFVAIGDADLCWSEEGRFHRCQEAC